MSSLLTAAMKMPPAIFCQLKRYFGISTPSVFFFFFCFFFEFGQIHGKWSRYRALKYMHSEDLKSKPHLGRINYLASLFKMVDAIYQEMSMRVNPSGAVSKIMMTSSNGNIFRVTGHLCGEFTGPRWIPSTKASDTELWCFLWFAPE